MTTAETRYFELGDLPLESGETLAGARLAYATYGRLNAARDNAVLAASAFGGTHADSEWLIAPGRALDPARWFTIATNLFGNGVSTSPSNAGPAQRGDAFPFVSIGDNVAAQRRLVDSFGIERLALVTGFSMGAIQAYYWACAFPPSVARVAAVCGAAKTAHHTAVFLDGMERLMRLPIPEADMKETLGRCWAPWGLSQTFWREERWAALGASSRAEAVSNYAARFGARDRYDMLAMLRAWRAADVGTLAPYGGDTNAALAAVQARALVMPSRTDCYFPPEDSAREVTAMRHAELAVIDSVFGHAAGANLDPAAGAFVDRKLAELLAQPN